MLVDAAPEPKPQQVGVKLLVPGARSLTQSIECFVEVEHFMLVIVDDEAWRLLNVHLLLEFAVQERRFDVYVMDALAEVIYDCKHQPH